MTPPTTGTAPETANFAVLSATRSTFPETPPATARYAVNSVSMSLSAPADRLPMPSASPRSTPFPAAASTTVTARYTHTAGTSRPSISRKTRSKANMEAT